MKINNENYHMTSSRENLQFERESTFEIKKWLNYYASNSSDRVF